MNSLPRRVSFECCRRVMRELACQLAIVAFCCGTAPAIGAGAAGSRSGEYRVASRAASDPDYTAQTKALQGLVDHGDLAAMNALAIMYAQGIGARKSARTAMKLFQRAASEGYAPAMINLGTMYAAGAGVHHDACQAYAWLRAALSAGVPDEEHDATVFKLGIVADRLDSAQLARAEALAAKRVQGAGVRRFRPALPSDTEPPLLAIPISRT
jgi:TPR repeat protein